MAGYLVHILLPGGEGTVDQDLLLGRDLQIHVTLHPPAHRGTTLYPKFLDAGSDAKVCHLDYIAATMQWAASIDILRDLFKPLTASKTSQGHSHGLY